MKFNHYILILVGLLAASACDLSEEPYGFYSEDNFYQSEADAEAAVTYAYDALTFLEYSRTVFLLGDLPTDECGPKADEGPDAQDLNNWKVDNFSTNRSLVNFFKYAYIAINRSNAILENIPQSPIDDELKTRYLGEAYFLRAYNYFNLVRNFGEVPMHTSLVASLDDTSAPLAQDLQEVYDLILSDCRMAVSLLSEYQMTGRADKVAAQALAAKVYLHMASSKANGVPRYESIVSDANTLYDSASYYAGEVINEQSTYGFDDNLIDIYDVDQPKGPEHIFLMSMDRSGTIEGDYSKISKLFIPYIAGDDIYLPDGDGSFTVSHDGWSVFQTKESFYNTFDGADLRGQVLLVDRVYDADGNEIASVDGGGIPYRFTRKYVDPHFINDKTSTKPFLLRYSDIALIYAEAAGPTAEAYALVNYIRNRAGLGELTTGLSVEDFREAVWQERSWELMFEGNRLYDLRRYNRVNDLVEEAAGLSDEEVAYYPLPQIELDLNQGL
ncbi:RagB/SusD family nutrient uptake outer membrane protein [Marinoscillum furvescens]|uniref:YD repeat-containing protein n=1 Tax=Marinoscillum furvescens DSM 4134 TaxID=1122208 RepID=A0A3D9KZ35_MARFU|nr:RagB/SusD family nutrient uptake outer membrane protein [Marinoscillum furvescens]RED95300.1 YD repeat-containing protein [Marinoscillum furvescens DSM 4134]